MASRITSIAVFLTGGFLGGCGSGGGGSAWGPEVSGAGGDGGVWRSWRGYQAAHGGPAAAKDGLRLPDKPELQDYLTHAALHSPELEAAFHRWKAAAQRVPQVTALPDPRFTYSYYFQEVETRVGPQRQAFMLAQTFPWFGKLQRRGDAAAEAAKAEWQRFQAQKLQLYFQVTKAYNEYFYLGRAVKVTEENLKLLRQVEDIARTRYKTQAASHPDVIRLQVELGKLDDRLQTLQQLRGPAVARLNALLGRPEGEGELPWPQSVPHEVVAPGPEQLLASMLESNPQLLAMDREIARAKDEIDLARKEYFPDTTVGVTYIDTGSSRGPMHPGDSGKDPVIGMITVNIPIWWSKLSAGVREAQHRHLAAQRSRGQAAADLVAQLRTALYEVQDAQRKIVLYRDMLLPKARESLQVTQAGFIGGTSSFNDLIDAQRILLEFELSHQRALADYATWRAALEQIVGREIPTSGNP